MMEKGDGKMKDFYLFIYFCGGNIEGQKGKMHGEILLANNFLNKTILSN